MIVVHEPRDRTHLNSWLRTLVSIALLSISVSSRADVFAVIESESANELWLNPGMYSYHLKAGKGLNNNNFGFGVEYRYSTVSSVTLGTFHNSFRETSRYAGWYWQPFGVGPFRVGAAAGAINGYSRERNGSWFFLVIPALSLEYGHIGANLLYVPSHARDGGAISLQLKLRAF